MNVENSEKDKIVLNDDERTTCEVWTRVMGYYKSTEQFNDGKKTETKERKPFEEPTRDK
ncbi:MAG: anaerobic ribonucleoside-triphosphate reductase [Holosporales bacterium]|jgi:anaerobic ribonucleoside-triphosphate reductase|nr:anaerobic ribonucleoside-triphosphate reductase [Holosporales bacterium]